MDAAVKLNFMPTISQEDFEQRYMTLEESSARMDEVITRHYHPEA